MKKTFPVDDITWNDLDMEEIYARMDRAYSSVGSEYLKKTLRSLESDEDILIKRDDKAKAISSEEAARKGLQKIFKSLGKSKKVSFLDHIFKLDELPKQSSLKHVILILLLLAAAGLIFINPAIGIVALVVMIALNIALYFAFRAKVEAYFNCLKYLVAMVNAADKIVKKDLPTAFDEDKELLKGLSGTFAPLRRGSWLLTNSVSGSLTDVILDYIRMIFHVDLIKFNSMKNKVAASADEIKCLYDTLGEIELSICICLFRKEYPEHTSPSFVKKKMVKATSLYHPLITGPVKNDIDAERSILLTGSNASGKSTFLKTLAVNQIFAQTIYTVLASEYESGIFKVMSSMELTDNIMGNESYFVVEIKSLKRIFDEADDETSVLVFVDEVLRGTNTAERIAASSELLAALSARNALVFAATHDIELTFMLEDRMDNHHFSEEVIDDNVIFDYKIKDGRATSRNAIKLLKAYGFDEAIVEAAEKKARGTA